MDQDTRDLLDALRAALDRRPVRCLFTPSCAERQDGTICDDCERAILVLRAERALGYRYAVSVLAFEDGGARPRAAYLAEDGGLADAAGAHLWDGPIEPARRAAAICREGKMLAVLRKVPDVEKFRRGESR